MSMFSYIGAPRELPLGQRGGKRSQEQINNHHSSIIMFRDNNPPFSLSPEQLYNLNIKEEDIEVYDSMRDLAGEDLR